MEYVASSSRRSTIKRRVIAVDQSSNTLTYLPSKTMPIFGSSANSAKLPQRDGSNPIGAEPGTTVQHHLSTNCPPASSAMPTESGRRHFGFVWQYTEDLLVERAALACKSNEAISTWYGSEPPTFIMTYLANMREQTNQFRARLNMWFQQNQNPHLSEQRAFDILTAHLANLSTHSVGPVGKLSGELLQTMVEDIDAMNSIQESLKAIREDEHTRLASRPPYFRLRDQLKAAMEESENSKLEFDMVLP